MGTDRSLSPSVRFLLLAYLLTSTVAAAVVSVYTVLCYTPVESVGVRACWLLSSERLSHVSKSLRKSSDNTVG
jgi:hypothetical protein